MEKCLAYKKLVELVQGLQDSDPHEAYGVMWAARPQSFYSEALGVSLKTIGRYTDESPFVKKVKSVEGGGTITLLRIGEAPASLYDNHTKNILIKLWDAREAKIDRPDGPLKLTDYAKSNLWGFAKDIRENIGDKMGLPAETSQELAIATFKYALADWTAVAGSVKFVGQARAGYKPRYWKYINLPTLNSFSEVAVYAYVMHVQFDKPKLPVGLECLADMMVSAKLLNHIESLLPEGCVLS
jgi:hypothetical protein